MFYFQTCLALFFIKNFPQSSMEPICQFGSRQPLMRLSLKRQSGTATLFGNVAKMYLGLAGAASTNTQHRNKCSGESSPQLWSRAQRR